MRIKCNASCRAFRVCHFIPFNTETLEGGQSVPATSQLGMCLENLEKLENPWHSKTYHSTTEKRCLSLGAPDALEETIPLCQSVESIVALSHGPDESREGVDVVLAGDLTAGLIDLGNGDLDGSVVLGLDNPVRGGALSGDVAIGEGIELAYQAMSCQHAVSSFFE